MAANCAVLRSSLHEMCTDRTSAPCEEERIVQAAVQTEESWGLSRTQRFRSKIGQDGYEAPSASSSSGTAGTSNILVAGPKTAQQHSESCTVTAHADEREDGRETAGTWKPSKTVLWPSLEDGTAELTWRQRLARVMELRAILGLERFHQIDVARPSGVGGGFRMASLLRQGAGWGITTGVHHMQHLPGLVFRAADIAVAKATLQRAQRLFEEAHRWLCFYKHNGPVVLHLLCIMWRVLTTASTLRVQGMQFDMGLCPQYHSTLHGSPHWGCDRFARSCLNDSDAFALFQSKFEKAYGKFTIDKFLIKDEDAKIGKRAKQKFGRRAKAMMFLRHFARHLKRKGAKELWKDPATHLWRCGFGNGLLLGGQALVSSLLCIMHGYGSASEANPRLLLESLARVEVILLATLHPQASRNAMPRDPPALSNDMPRDPPALSNDMPRDPPASRKHLAFRFRLQAFPLQFTPGMNRNLPWSFWGVLIQALIFDNAKFEVDVYEMQSPSSLHYAGYAATSKLRVYVELMQLTVASPADLETARESLLVEEMLLQVRGQIADAKVALEILQDREQKLSSKKRKAESEPDSQP
ncbi:Cryptochrome DASH [Durusdinium trenchii]|uniref:Chloroplastic/mitochondrial n=2 Tax=Durusdinium trenchii TaxID=1381693 RepID=A0ABP0I3Q5_9DINO